MPEMDGFKIMEKLHSDDNTENIPVIFLTADNLAEAEQYIEFERVILQKASAIVSGNCGIGTFGLMFMRKEDESY